MLCFLEDHPDLKLKNTVKPVLSDHIKQDFKTGGCLLLHESSAESSRSFLHYFHSAISNHLSITISMSSECMVE